MTKDKMKAISIAPGYKIQAQHFRLADGGIEYNVQNEFDHRTENLFTPQVINKAISSDSDWGLSGWNPANSLKITTSDGDIICDRGIAYIGGRRYIRIGSGSIKSQVDMGVSGNGNYFIRIKYIVSNDTHTFIAEATPSPNTNDTKYITLAKATVSGYPIISWSNEIDLRSSNTSLQPPVNFSGDTDTNSVPVLLVEQTGSVENAFEVLGGDAVLFTANNPFKQVIYGNDTVALRLYSGASNYGDLRANSTTTNYLSTPGSFGIGTNLTVTGQSTLGSVIVNGSIISSTTSIGALETITLATTGASVTLSNASDQTIAFTNSGTGNLNMSIDGKLTVNATGTTIASSATVGGVVLNANDITADALNLKDNSSQIILDSNGTPGILGTAGVLSNTQVWTLPDATGTIAVSGSPPISVNSTTGQITHSTANGYVHIPSNGSSTQILQYSSAGTAKWVTLSGDISVTDGGVVTVFDNSHSHNTSTISGLDISNDISTGTLAVGFGGTGKTSWTSYGIIYASTSTTLDQITNGGYYDTTYVLVGGTPPSFTSSPTIRKLTVAWNYSTPPSSGVNVIIRPTTAITSGVGMTLLKLDFINMAPTADGTYIGIDIDASTMTQTTSTYCHGLRVSMPSTYTASQGYAATFSGGGRKVEICNKTLAINTSYACRLGSPTSGQWVTTGTLDPLDGAKCGYGSNTDEYYSEGWFYKLYYHSAYIFDIYDDIKLLRGMKPSGTISETGAPELDPTTIPDIIKANDTTSENGWINAASYTGLIRGAVVQLAEKTLNEKFIVTIKTPNIEKRVNITKCFNWMEADKDEIFIQATPSIPCVFGADIEFDDNDEAWVVLKMMSSCDKDIKFSVQIGCNIKSDRMCYESVL
mgnify:CR=1 FL=1